MMPFIINHPIKGCVCVCVCITTINIAMLLVGRFEGLFMLCSCPCGVHTAKSLVVVFVVADVRVGVEVM